MKRKIDSQEARLSQLLFNKSQDLVERLKPSPSIEDDEDLKPAWKDEDDEHIVVTKSNTKVNYTEKLKQKYETLLGTPSWAKLTKKLKREDNDEDNEILRTVGHIQKKKTELHLKKDFIELKTLPQINYETSNEGLIISCVEFHPKLSVALVGGSSGGVSLFSIGGDVNHKLHNFHLDGWKINAAQFAPSGNETYLASKFSHSYCVYDLIKAQPTLIQLPRVVKRPKIFQLSPNGSYIATSDGFDEIYLISSASKELLRCLKHNAYVESVVFSHNSEDLYCYCIQGEITIWDLKTFRPLRKFHDNGCVNASCITTSPCGRLLATGSGEGIINVYETSKLDTVNPLPTKTITNLVTKISRLKFNATTEILAATSYLMPNAIKLVHLPSYHVFINFPRQNDNLFNIEAINFSPNSGYMALGNSKGQAKLYRLKYFKNY